ncbi:S41 family peptidase [Stieleria marina]|uniref:Putative CtpA-like serine protease n=1 Tax=Stieleria marina TaxID=1930275 RepID=A0A517NWJ3_9BACT|nr:putative CtpA-like serine protease [Planctomycetes bacterium K23_9]
MIASSLFAAQLTFSTATLSAQESGAYQGTTQVLKPLVPVKADKLATADALAEAENAALETGFALESQSNWAEAIQHYEKHSRANPESKTLYQRLIICRLHYDVNRRFVDSSYNDSLKKLSLTQSLDLYSEILANLETHYVEQVEWSRILLHGTAALEVALTEDKFIQSTLSGADPAAIERFRQGVHRRLSNRSSQTRFDVRASVAHVADLAQKELGLSPTATVLEYVSGAVSTLDTYTRLLSGDQLKEMFSNIEGNFVGLGVELKSDDNSLQILSVIPGGPAEESGVKAGDRIVRVESSRTTVVDPDYAADLLRGPEHTYVSIGVVSPNGQERDMRIQRRRVDVPCVENVRFVEPNQKIGYLRLTNFQKTTTRDIERALWDLQRQGMRSLVLDVRGNPGGLLSAAVEVADRFLDKGRIVTTRGRNARENFDYVAHRPNTWNIPLAVLIDSDSASASEIFAGAISDTGRGIIVGETSYGKGSVQGIFRMQAANFGLCLTTAKFYSPSGREISRNGVEPKFPVDSPDSPYIALRPDNTGHVVEDHEDNVLQKAIEQLVQRSQTISQRP